MASSDLYLGNLLLFFHFLPFLYLLNFNLVFDYITIITSLLST